jgi:hypothetical protein
MTGKSFRRRPAFSRAATMLAAALLLSLPAACDWGKPKLLVFDTVFLDFMSSGTGEKFTTPEEVAGAKRVSEVLRKGMAELGTYRVLAPKPSEDGDDAPLDLTCAECVLDLARAQDADFILTSAVTRASGAIQFLKVELDDVKTEKAVKVGNVQLAGLSATQLEKAAQFALKEIIGGETKKAGAESR